MPWGWAVRFAQFGADGLVVGFVLWWLWRRYGRSLRESLPPARKIGNGPGSGPGSAAKPSEGEGKTPR